MQISVLWAMFPFSQENINFIGKEEESQYKHREMNETGAPKYNLQERENLICRHDGPVIR